MAKDSIEEEKNDLLKYRKKQEKKYLTFKNKLELWILEEKYNDSDESCSEKVIYLHIKASHQIREATQMPQKTKDF